ncbi:MAG: hypothetical protein L3K17_02960 [Thermoplasmata archaeon]|nr:hypothetical protein [Thermoplasmata archaeon]
MVHIKDEGSHFDAPRETVWKFLQSNDAHGASHTGTRNQQMKPINETSFVVSMEQEMGGHWVKVANRITILPPVAMAIEVIEGPMTGSKMINVYTAKGNKTGIDVYGEFTSAQIPAAQLESAVHANLAEVFEQDAAAIKAFASKM